MEFEYIVDSGSFWNVFVFSILFAIECDDWCWRHLIMPTRCYRAERRARAIVSMMSSISSTCQVIFGRSTLPIFSNTESHDHAMDQFASCDGTCSGGGNSSHPSARMGRRISQRGGTAALRTHVGRQFNGESLELLISTLCFDASYVLHGRLSLIACQADPSRASFLLNVSMHLLFCM